MPRQKRTARPEGSYRGEIVQKWSKPPAVHGGNLSVPEKICLAFHVHLTPAHNTDVFWDGKGSGSIGIVAAKNGSISRLLMVESQNFY